MPKNKTHKGLAKRIRITKSGKVKIGRSGARHLKSHKSGARVRQYRSSTYVCAAEAGRLGAMLNKHVKSQEAHAADKQAKADAEATTETKTKTESKTKTKTKTTKKTEAKAE